MLYLKWCNVLNIDPKEEKVKKPFVCRGHFHPSDVLLEIGILKPGVAPKKCPRRLKQVKSGKLKLLQVAKTFPVEIKSELNDEISLEEPRFADDNDNRLIIHREQSPGDDIIDVERTDDEDIEFLDSLLADMQRMTSRQRNFFKQEMQTKLDNLKMKTS